MCWGCSSPASTDCFSDGEVSVSSQRETHTLVQEVGSRMDQVSCQEQMALLFLSWFHISVNVCHHVLCSEWGTCWKSQNNHTVGAAAHLTADLMSQMHTEVSLIMFFIELSTEKLVWSDWTNYTESRFVQSWHNRRRQTTWSVWKRNVWNARDRSFYDTFPIPSPR